MSRSLPLVQPRPHVIWSHGIAVLSVTAALTLSRLSALHLEAAPVSLFLCAVMFSAWFGGIGPGSLATALSTVAFYYYFLQPIYSFSAKPEEIPRLVVFALSAMFVGLLSAAQRSATESLRRARDDLTGTVQQLQNTNAALRAESIERKHTEDKLRRSEAYLAEGQRLSHTGSWAWNVITEEIVHQSEEHHRLFGFVSERDAGSLEAIRRRIHMEDRDRVRETWDQAARERSDYVQDYRLVLPDGAVKYIHAEGHPVFNEGGDLVEFVGTSIDVSERRLAEEQREKLRQAQADLAHVSRVTTMGELSASLAHEVKQPIAAAVTDANTCLRWLTRERPDLEEARAAAMRVVNDATRASEIVNRIRLLFKKGASPRELVDVNEVIREMIVLLRNETMRYAIAVRTELAVDIPQVMADRVQLQQVMMNLIMNSIDAMSEADGTRELAIKSQPAENGQLMVSVSDTGVGLPPQQTEQIFNAFFTTKVHGTGMGLSISRSIIESHDGRLWAAANSTRGASFYFTLPTKVEVHE
ncbi:MAG TPA: ATP-binding protein [Verrucomicrobiae bacterium]|jgi:PAS domain S-box-containing protein|nr:ATP-binding protein [Verrucomicrobiae bacterium]